MQTVPHMPMNPEHGAACESMADVHVIDCCAIVALEDSFAQLRSEK